MLNPDEEIKGLHRLLNSSAKERKLSYLAVALSIIADYVETNRDELISNRRYRGLQSRYSFLLNLVNAHRESHCYNLPKEI